jgi:hypothetical protein
MSGHNTLPGPRKKFLFTKYFFKNESQPRDVDINAPTLEREEKRKKKKNE